MTYLLNFVQLLNNPGAAVSKLNSITHNTMNLGSVEIGVTTVLLESVSNNPMTLQDRNVSTITLASMLDCIVLQVSENFLGVVDNLISVDPD